jgi:excisionase family DNA binding protein
MTPTEKTTTAVVATKAVRLSDGDETELHDIYDKLRKTNAKLVSQDGKTQILPSTLYSFLCKLLADLKDGHSVTILESNAALTTVGASKLLGMSRQFLIGLLEKNEIPFHMVGSHRRLYVRDVLLYKAKRDAARSKTLNDLARRESEQGTYDKVPDDFRVNDSDPGQ